MIQSSTIYKNTRNINDDNTLLDVAMECAYFLEQIGALAFRNWTQGEVVAGPYVNRFHVTVSFMFPIARMPDLTVIDRLKKMNCKVSYEQDSYKRVVTYKEGDSDIYRQKAVMHKVWILTIKIPNRYLALDGNTRFTIDDYDVDYEDIEATYNMETEESENAGDDGGMGGDDDFGMGGDDEFEV